MEAYRTDDLAFAAALLTFGARVRAVEWIPEKRKCDLILDQEDLDLGRAVLLVKALMIRMEAQSLSDVADLELMYRGSILHEIITHYIDLKRLVLARRPVAWVGPA